MPPKSVKEERVMRQRFTVRREEALSLTVPCSADTYCTVSSLIFGIGRVSA